MSVGPILTLGIGAFTGGGVKYIPTLGYGTGATPPPPTPVIDRLPSGVRKGKARKINLRDLENREDLGQFLRSQLNLRQFKEDAPLPAPKVIAEQKRIATATKAMLKARAEEERLSIAKQLLDENNEIIKQLLLLGNR